VVELLGLDGKVWGREGYLGCLRVAEDEVEEWASESI
jgi:hypothetical protein